MRSIVSDVSAGRETEYVVPLAPLQPIPAIGEPFDCVLVDCAGSLPRTKSGYQYLLTIMCAAKRYPEAILLRKITTPAVVRVLVRFFSTFGLRSVIQTDEGTNFTVSLFNQIFRELLISHATSSPYHPESQGTFERFCQSLKNMLKCYCFDTHRDWDESVPLVFCHSGGSTRIVGTQSCGVGFWTFRTCSIKGDKT